MRPILLAFALGLLPAFSALAGPSLGRVRYDFSNDMRTITLGSDLIQNKSKENATGTLKLQLWASSAPYNGGTIRGSLLGTTGNLEGLKPGQYYQNLRRTVTYDPPAANGSYFLTMLLLEYKSGGYVIVNHVNMGTKKTLGPLALFKLDGPWRWQTSYEGGTVTMEVAKISHRRTGRTGSLKLSVWLTDSPYRGGRLSGYEIGEVRKDPLQPGYYYENVKNTAKFSPPPNGTYYASLVLSESDGSAFNVVAHLASTTPSRFTAPAR